MVRTSPKASPFSLVTTFFKELFLTDLQQLIYKLCKGIQGARVFDLYFLLLIQYLGKYGSRFVTGKTVLYCTSAKLWVNSTKKNFKNRNKKCLRRSGVLFVPTFLDMMPRKIPDFSRLSPAVGYDEWRYDKNLRLCGRGKWSEHLTG
jgi:hypothetical protein